MNFRDSLIGVSSEGPATYRMICPAIPMYRTAPIPTSECSQLQHCSLMFVCSEYGVYESRTTTTGAGPVRCDILRRRHRISTIDILGNDERVKFVFSPGIRLNPPQKYACVYMRTCMLQYYYKLLLHSIYVQHTMLHTTCIPCIVTTVVLLYGLECMYSPCKLNCGICNWVM